MKEIFLLGSTGSIGRSTLDVVSQHPDEFRIRTLAAYRNVELLSEQISKLKPENAVIFDYESYCRFTEKYEGNETHVAFGLDALSNIVQDKEHHLFLNAFVGFAGLEPTARAIECGLDIALANKETLVVAGALISHLAEQNNIRLLPIDSEHSAIWQCLVGEENNAIKRIILTASGGPFRGKKKADLADVTPEEALKHPNWNMGAKITIDSATMMNKGLEVIEAHWLYDIPAEKIEVIIHPQSIIHSMVEFSDNSVKAQLGIPDMRIPIQYALSYPRRLPLAVTQMDFSNVDQLQFERPDMASFPCLRLAYEALQSGKSYPAVLNAANEIAVDGFLHKKVRFNDIAEIIDLMLQKHNPKKVHELYEYVEIDRIARDETIALINMKQK